MGFWGFGGDCFSSPLSLNFLMLFLIWIGIIVLDVCVGYGFGLGVGRVLGPSPLQGFLISGWIQRSSSYFLISFIVYVIIYLGRIGVLFQNPYPKLDDVSERSIARPDEGGGSSI